MQQVDIYLYPSSRAPKLKEGYYYWKARCRGVPREGTGQAGECTSGQRLVLMCAAAALKIVIRPAMLTIHTDSYYLVGNKTAQKPEMPTSGSRSWTWKVSTKSNTN